MAARFWVGGSGTWDASSTTNWAATSGGAGGASVPGAADDVTIDASSGSGTITVATNFTINSLTCGAMAMTLDFSTNNNSPTIGTFTGTGSGVRTINMGNGTWTLTGLTHSFFGNSTNLTVNAGGSNLVFTNSSNSTLTIAITQNFTLNKITLSRGSSTGTVAFTVGGTPTTITTIIDTGTAAHTLQFQQLRTYNISNFAVRGAAGAVVTIQSNGASPVTFNKSPLGLISTDYLTISATNPVTATPASTWYIGPNGVTNGNSGWIATAGPTRRLSSTGVG